VRFLIAAGAGLSVALLLFVLMNALISGEQQIDRGALDGSLVDFIRVREEEIAQFKERERPEEPPPPVEPPPPPSINVSETMRPAHLPLEIELPDIVVASAAGSGPYLGQWSPGDEVPDGDVVALFQVPPQYPPEAARDRIEGWVKIRFTILPDGTVADPKVLESAPRRVFDRSAMTAILRWKFKPRIVDGQAVPRPAELTIDYTLPD